jgi:Autotransporter beta-domain
MKWVRLSWAVMALGAGSARAQTMLDQQQRLIEVHSLLLDLPLGDAPGAYRPGEVSLGVEVIGIPTINGQTGGKVQFTASDRTFAFPRPRLAIGLPAPDGFRAFVGLSYIPPITILEINEHFLALEGGLAWVPEGPWAVGIRAHALVSRAKTSVTESDTRDTLDDLEFGGDLSAGYRFDLSSLTVTPFAGVGVTRVIGNFRVTSDNVLLTSRTTNPSVTGGVRLFARPGLTAIAEVVVFPGRLVHPSISLAWTFDWFVKR